jgi:hypothetical protein
MPLSPTLEADIQRSMTDQERRAIYRSQMKIGDRVTILIDAETILDGKIAGFSGTNVLVKTEYGSFWRQSDRVWLVK